MRKKSPPVAIHAEESSGVDKDRLDPESNIEETNREDISTRENGESQKSAGHPSPTPALSSDPPAPSAPVGNGEKAVGGAEERDDADGPANESGHARVAEPTAFSPPVQPSGPFFSSSAKPRFPTSCILTYRFGAASTADGASATTDAGAGNIFLGKNAGTSAPTSRAAATRSRDNRWNPTNKPRRRARNDDEDYHPGMEKESRRRRDRRREHHWRRRRDEGGAGSPGSLRGTETGGGRGRGRIGRRGNPSRGEKRAAQAILPSPQPHSHPLLFQRHSVFYPNRYQLPTLLALPGFPPLGVDKRKVKRGSKRQESTGEPAASNCAADGGDPEADERKGGRGRAGRPRTVRELLVLHRRGSAEGADRPDSQSALASDDASADAGFRIPAFPAPGAAILSALASKTRVTDYRVGRREGDSPERKRMKSELVRLLETPWDTRDGKHDADFVYENDEDLGAARIFEAAEKAELAAAAASPPAECAVPAPLSDSGAVSPPPPMDFPDLCSPVLPLDLSTQQQPQFPRAAPLPASSSPPLGTVPFEASRYVGPEGIKPSGAAESRAALGSPQRDPRLSFPARHSLYKRLPPFAAAIASAYGGPDGAAESVGYASSDSAGATAEASVTAAVTGSPPPNGDVDPSRPSVIVTANVTAEVSPLPARSMPPDTRYTITADDKDDAADSDEWTIDVPPLPSPEVPGDGRKKRKPRRCADKKPLGATRKQSNRASYGGKSKGRQVGARVSKKRGKIGEPTPAFPSGVTCWPPVDLDVASPEGRLPWTTGPCGTPDNETCYFPSPGCDVYAFEARDPPVPSISLSGRHAQLPAQTPAPALPDQPVARPRQGGTGGPPQYRRAASAPVFAPSACPNRCIACGACKCPPCRRYCMSRCGGAGLVHMPYAPPREPATARSEDPRGSPFGAEAFHFGASRTRSGCTYDPTSPAGAYAGHLLGLEQRDYEGACILLHLSASLFARASKAAAS